MHGELQKLGIEIAQATVSKYLARRRPPPSPTWRTFLDNHLRSLVAVDFFTVPTVLFKVVFVFVVLAHARRRVVHVNVTHTPTAEWTAQQLVEAFPWDTSPRYRLRDHDAIYGAVGLSLPVPSGSGIRTDHIGQRSVPFALNGPSR